jgi:dethiobiotin synthetase
LKREINPIFITGIGTGIGKTVVSAIVTEALQFHYWKPIQAGFDEGTDSEFVASLISNSSTKIFPEAYKLKKAASPHIAAKEEGVEIDVSFLVAHFSFLIEGPKPNKVAVNEENQETRNVIIEGAGGMLVPLNEKEFVIDLIKMLNAKVILVSRNYLGSINHSLLTAAACKQHNVDVLGWIFNDQYLDYENEIVQWSGYPKIASIPFTQKIDKQFIKEQAIIVSNKFTALFS